MSSAAPPFDDRRLLLAGIPLIALLALLARNGQATLTLSAAQWALGYGIALSYSLLFWLGVRALWRGLLRGWPAAAHTRRRLVLLGLGSVAYTLAATLLLAETVHYLFGAGRWLTRAQFAWELLFNALPTLVILLLYESIHFFQQWQANLRRADQLAQAATQAQLDALARQLDPHFLFNSLNTLSALIEPQNEPAQHYVEGLADVYRYVLLARERPTVPLAEELAFVQTYITLQQVRFGGSLLVSYDLGAGPPAGRVAPLSVQGLVENALKHNEASRARPLVLRLVATAGAVRVENAYQPRPAGLVPGTGTGLANLRQRYALLGAGPVAVEQAGGTFAVTLPLLPAS